MTNIYDILVRPIVTEKSAYQTSSLGQYVFEVAMKATKAQIKEAVEILFDVTVLRVNVVTIPAKRSRRLRNRRLLIRKAGYKKAVVTLAPGSSIDVFEGVR